MYDDVDFEAIIQGFSKTEDLYEEFRSYVLDVIEEAYGNDTMYLLLNVYSSIRDLFKEHENYGELLIYKTLFRLKQNNTMVWLIEYFISEYAYYVFDHVSEYGFSEGEDLS